jgi:nitroreductase
MRLSKNESPDHAIHELLVKRWRPYAFSDQPVPEKDLRAVFEAARWTASSYNEQPWRHIVATRKDPEGFKRLALLPGGGESALDQVGSVLALGCAALKFALSGR